MTDGELKEALGEALVELRETKTQLRLAEERANRWWEQLCEASEALGLITPESAPYLGRHAAAHQAARLEEVAQRDQIIERLRRHSAEALTDMEERCASLRAEVERLESFMRSQPNRWALRERVGELEALLHTVSEHCKSYGHDPVPQGICDAIDGALASALASALTGATPEDRTKPPPGCYIWKASLDTWLARVHGWLLTATFADEDDALRACWDIVDSAARWDAWTIKTALHTTEGGKGK